MSEIEAYVQVRVDGCIARTSYVLKFDGLLATLECPLIQVVLSLMSCQWSSCAAPVFVKKRSSQSGLVESNEVYAGKDGILHDTHQTEPFERRSRRR